MERLDRDDPCGVEEVDGHEDCGVPRFDKEYAEAAVGVYDKCLGSVQAVGEKKRQDKREEQLCRIGEAETEPQRRGDDRE